MILFLFVSFLAGFLNSKFFKKENFSLIYIVLGLISPVFFFVGLDFGLEILKINNLERFSVITFFVMTAIYNLILLSNNNNNDNIFSFNYYLIIAMVLLNLDIIKITVLILLLLYSSFLYKDQRITFPKRVFIYYPFLILLLSTTFKLPVTFIIIVTSLLYLEGLLVGISREKILSLLILNIFVDKYSTTPNAYLFGYTTLVLLTALYCEIKEVHRLVLLQKIKTNQLVKKLVLVRRLKLPSVGSIGLGSTLPNRVDLTPLRNPYLPHVSDKNFTYVVVFILTSLLLLMEIFSWSN